jgi:hypothetical protein
MAQEASLLGRLAGDIGRGILAGAVGTAAMTISSTVEMKLRDRDPSTVPAEAASQVLGVRVWKQDQAKFANVVHWQYGSSIGALRGLLSAFGLREPLASGIFFTTVWGIALAMVPKLSDAPPLKEWGPEDLAIDAFHHLVYAAATGLAISTLFRARSKR